MRSAVVAESAAAARDEWNRAEVIKRLREAGLVVVDAKRRAARAPLGEGDVITVSGSDMQLFFFPDAADRARASATLDTSSLKPGAAAPAPGRPRFVISNNLIAAYTTPNDRLAERIEDALTARHRGAP
ncbi:MAG: hypothetical protein ABJD07_04480 [Gemmatimonadaceae bacterium]